jgi:hypothetical protein
MIKRKLFAGRAYLNLSHENMARLFAFGLLAAAWVIAINKTIEGRHTSMMLAFMFASTSLSYTYWRIGLRGVPLVIAFVVFLQSILV